MFDTFVVVIRHLKDDWVVDTGVRFVQTKFGAIFRGYATKCCIASSIAFLTLGGCPAKDGAAYFIVGELEPLHGDSYLLILNDPEDIAAARAILAHPDDATAKIVVASIEHGPGDPPNRDLLNEAREWSWHVKEFTEFAELTIEILDGWPTYVEENLDAWFETTEGAVGFWSYTVVQEVSEEEVLSR